MVKGGGFKAALCGVAFLFLTGCHSDGIDQNFRIGTNVWLGYEPLYAAQAAGDFEGSEIRFVEYRSSSQVRIAFSQGVIDAAALTYDEAISLAAQGNDLTVVLIMDTSHGGDAVVLKPPYSSLANLRGACIAYETSAVGDFMFHKALTHFGLDQQDVCHKPSDIGHHLEDYQRPDVGAMITFEPYLSELVEAGGRVVFSSADVPNAIVDVLVVRTEDVQTYEAEIQQLIQSWYNVIKVQHADPDQFAALVNHRLKLNQQEINLMLSGIKLPDQAEALSLMTDRRWAKNIEDYYCTVHPQMNCQNLALEFETVFIQQEGAHD